MNFGNVPHLSKTKLLPALLLMLIYISGAGQTTYTWNATSGGDLGVGTNWTPTRSAAANTDILQFTDGGTYTVTNVTTQVLNKLLVTGGTKITLQSSASATIQINGAGFTDNLVIAANSRLSLNSGSMLNLSIVNTTSNQQGDISGILEVNANSVFTTSNSGTFRVNVKPGGVINHYGGIITSTTATLIFNAGATYDYKATGSMAVPNATWDSHSYCKITGVTTGTPSQLGTQTFGNFIWDAPSQSAEISPSSPPLNVTDTFEVRNTNGNILSFAGGGGNFTWTWTGDLLITGGRLAYRTASLGGIRTLSVRNFTLDNTNNANAQFPITNISGSPGSGSATLTVRGDFNVVLGQNSSYTNVVEFRGGFTETITVAGNFTQTGNATGQISRAVNSSTQTFTFNGSGTNTYSAVKSNLFGTLTTIDVNAKTLDIGNSTIGFTGNFTLTGATAGIIIGATGAVANTGTFSANTAGQTLTLGSQQGITNTGSGAVGNVQSTGTRTFNVGNNYIYKGTNGQVTGTGLPANVTGSVNVFLANASDQITFTNTAAIGAAGTLRMIRGLVANAITYNASGILEYASTTGPQTTASTEFPSSSGPRTLIIKNNDGVTLHAARTVGILTFASGILNTSAGALTVGTASVTGNITGASSTAYVQGPLQRFFTTIATSTTQSFPVGKSTYNPIEIITTGTSVTGSNTFKAEAFDAVPPAGSTPGAGLGTLGSKHWQLTIESGSGTLAATSVRIAQVGIIGSSRIGYSATATGAYDNIGGTGPAANITSTAGALGNGGYFTIGDLNVIDAPTGTTPQNFCSAATVADLAATGTAITWYDSATGGTRLLPVAALIDGNTYYASQTIGTAESGRLAVAVNVGAPAAPAGNAAQAFCGTAVTVADLTATGTGIKWYDAATSGNVVSGVTPLVPGAHYYASQTVNGCESADRLDVQATVNPVPTATAPADQTYLDGQSVSSIILSGTPTGVTFDVAGGSAIGLADQSGVTSVPAFTAIAGNAVISIVPHANGCTGNTVSYNVTVNPGGFRWTGLTNTQWETPTNWQPNAPAGGPNDPTIDVTIPLTANQPVVPVVGKKVGHISVEANAVVTLTGDLEVWKNLSGATGNAATFNGAGVLILNGTTAQDISGLVNVGQLNIDNTAGVSVLSNGKLNVNKALVLQGGIFTNNGNVTLKSTAATTAYLDNFSLGNTGNYTGNLTVERHIANTNDGYRDLSSPVASTVADWAADFDVVGQDGVNCWYAYNPYPNLQEYIESSNSITTDYYGGFWSYTGLTRPLSAAKGFAARLYGANNPFPLTIDVTGAPYNGSQSVSITKTTSTATAADGWNLVGNPYPSPILWSDVKALNSGKTDGSYYVFRTSGEYTGNWGTHNGVTGTNGATNEISSSQGFFVLASANNTLNFENSVRTATPTAIFYKTDSTQPNEIRLKLSNNTQSDEIVAYTDPVATALYDKGYDAIKIAAGSTAYISYADSNNDYAISVLNNINVQTELPLNLHVADTGVYTLTATVLNLLTPGLTPYLKDAEANTYHNLITSPAPLTLNGGGLYKGRYSIVFQTATTSIADNETNSTIVYANNGGIIIKRSSNALAHIVIADVLGRTIADLNTDRLLTEIPLQQAGAYAFVKVTEGAKVSVNKVLIK